jgi:hypothetical protein
MKHKWIIDCATCGEVVSWVEMQPTECPNDSGHTVNSVEGGNASAPTELYLDDGTDVWKMEVNTSGEWVATKQT